MTSYTLNINELRTKLSASASNDEMAEILSGAFEQLKNDRDTLKKRSATRNKD